MRKQKIIHTLYTGLGGHANVVFPLLAGGFEEYCSSSLVFYGVEDLSPIYRTLCKTNAYPFTAIRKNKRAYIRPILKFKRILAQEQPDRIIIHNSELILGAIAHRNKYKNCKVFFVEHQDNGSKSRLQQFLSKYALKKADAVICLSENYRKELIENYSCKVPTVVIANGIDLEKYKPSNVKKDSPIAVFGMASRMMPTKDHFCLLQAFQQLLMKHADVRLKIAGTGETFAQVKAWSEQLNIADKVDFLGLLNEEQMQEFYREIEVYVLATTAETLSTGILQAMACGLPVITSDISNNKQIITHLENGLLYRNSDSEDLSKQMLFTYENNDTLGNLGEKARAHISANYAVNQMVENYISLVQS
jgi:glycosyltransferase involved in cell wall biosynthesis